MRHTLIPPEARLALHREYHARVVIALLFILAVAVLAGAGALFPAYLRAWSASRTALIQVASVQSDPNGNNLTKVEKALASDNALLAALGAGSKIPARFSDVIRSIAAIHSPVSVFSLGLSRLGTTTITITLTGIAPTRNDLLEFKTRLEGLAPGISVDVPIEELARSSNLPFSLQFTEKLP